ncbi:MAG: DMT family transporter [Pyrinomonadaceae bacterium]
MNIVYFYILLALLAGATLPTQAAVNNRMALTIGNPILAALISFLIGTLSLLIYIFATGTSISGLSLARTAPPVAWIGGLIGAFFVASTVALVPKLGVAMTFSLVIAGQMIVTLIIDHFGILGVPVREISIPRIIGMLMIIAGVVLIRRF